MLNQISLTEISAFAECENQNKFICISESAVHSICVTATHLMFLERGSMNETSSAKWTFKVGFSSMGNQMTIKVLTRTKEHISKTTTTLSKEPFQQQKKDERTFSTTLTKEHFQQKKTTFNLSIKYLSIFLKWLKNFLLEMS